MLAVIVFASVFGDTITTGVGDITSDFFAKSGITADVNGGGDGVAGGVDEEEENQLSGVWVFNNEVELVSEILIQNDISFSIPTVDITFNRILVTDYSIYYHEIAPGNVLKNADTAYEDIWYNSIIDFGSEPQEVSPEFYEWFTANATKQ